MPSVHRCKPFSSVSAPYRKYLIFSLFFYFFCILLEEKSGKEFSFFTYELNTALICVLCFPGTCSACLWN